jgi:hypothetical protein
MATAPDDADVHVVIPTAVNVLLLVNENIVFNLRKAQPSDLTLPSLYKRAFLVVNETDEVAVARQGQSG